MKGKAYLFLTVIFSVFLYLNLSCKKLDSEVIDQQYLNSKFYTRFRNKTGEESRLNENRDNALVQLFKTFPQCRNISQIDLPATINLKRVKALQKKVPEKCSYSVGSSSQKMLVKFIGESSFQNKKLRWILLDHDKLYQDQQLGVAVYKEPDILGFSYIGVFKSNISKKVRTEITAEVYSNKIRITAVTKWRQIYPIKQSNTFKSLYEVTKVGKILRR